MHFAYDRKTLWSSLLSAGALCAMLLHPTSASAQARGVAFKPVQEWSVGATQIGSAAASSGMKIPCVISTEYDNGFIVRFSGGSSEMLAMAVDFRQNVFTQGRKYDAMVSLGQSYTKQVTATAFTPNTLIFNLRPLNDFYAELKSSDALELNVEDNVLNFSLSSLAQAYSKLEACYDGKASPSIAPMIDPATRSAARSPNAMRPVLVPDVQRQALPKSFKDIVTASADRPVDGMHTQAMKSQAQAAATDFPSRNAAQQAPVTPIPARVSRSEGLTVPPRGAEPATTSSAVAARTQAVSPGTWRASSGEDVKTVLARWSDAAGYDLQWQASGDANVTQDVAVNGSFEQAVSQLLAENAAGNGISGHIVDESGASPAQPARLASASTWTANSGASFQSVVNDWAARENVAIVWKDRPDMTVKSPIRVNGAYENALQTLLDQYGNDSVRPVAQLNRDPDTGRKTLTIETDRAG